MRTCAVDEGDDSALPITLGHLAALECWAGEYDLALALATEGREHADRMGIRAPMPASVHVLVLAHQGCVGEARALGARDLAADESVGFMSAVALDLRSLGIAEFMAGDFPAAADHLLRALSISSREIGINEPAILRLHPDAIMALVALARYAEAAELTRQLDIATEANHHPWSTAMAARCHGLLNAANGELAGAVEMLETRPRRSSATAHAVRGGQDAPAAWQRAPASRPPDRRPPRTGDRPRHVHQAGHADPGAAGEHGAGQHQRPAAAENELTPVEQRIADLVAVGQTNREVAATAFIERPDR